MSKKYRIGIWGQFGDGGIIADGQAIRTNIITEELKNRYGEEKISILNTNNWKKHPVRFLWKTILLVATSESVIIFPADNGFKVVVPLISFINIFYRRRFFDVVIGGYLPALLQGHKLYIKLLQNFDALFVQTTNIRSDLEKLGLRNVKYLTNLKRLIPVKEEELVINNSKQLKVCLFSRITEDKGVIDAINAISIANNKLGKKVFSLDIFGIVGADFQAKFYELLDSNQDVVQYKGVANYNETVGVLKNYFALLFPTYFHGEGFPGCFIDAFNAGIPIIATDWLYNKDLITDGENGMLVPIKNPEKLSDAMIKLFNDRQLAYNISINNLRKSMDYAPEQVLKELYDALDQ